MPHNVHIKFFTRILSGLAALCLFCDAAVAKPISASEAKVAVKGWLRLDGRPMGKDLKGNIARVDTYSAADGVSKYYVIRFEQEGFIVVPADDEIEPIIAFSGSGQYDSSFENPLGALVNNDIASRMAELKELEGGGSKDKKFEAKAAKIRGKWGRLKAAADLTATENLSSVSDVRVSPFVQSQWDQEDVCSSYCYNYYTPNHYPCGCAATAMAQLMRYYQYPTTGIGVKSFSVIVDGVTKTLTTRGGNSSGGVYNWSQMALVPACGMTITQRQAIGALCYDASISINTEYTSDGSGAFPENVQTALLGTFKYSNLIFGGDEGSNIGAGLLGMVNPNLDAGYPLILGIDSGSEDGHAVLCDGYGYSFSTLYHHINMGWSGIDDAWYNLPDIIGEYAYYTSIHVCLYNIYTSGSGEIISGRVIDGSGAAISGATVTAGKVGGGSYGTVTNAKGIFAFAKMPSSSTYNLSVVKSGYLFEGKTVSTGSSTDGSYISGNYWGADFQAITQQPPVANDGSVSTGRNVPVTITLSAEDDGLPNPPGSLSYIITSLPNSGHLEEIGFGSILSVPYQLSTSAGEVRYAPSSGFMGSDDFKFKVSDSGTVPYGGESNEATVSIGVAEYFTEIFDLQDNDLSYQSLTFLPYDSNGATTYRVCRQESYYFPTDPCGGTVFSMGDNSYSDIYLSDGKQVWLFGQGYDLFFVGSNGYITFNLCDTERVESAASHFSRPRIAALFDDLNPEQGGQASYKQLGDRIAVTFENIHEYGMAAVNSFQMELFFDGTIRLTYLKMESKGGLVGLSDGGGVPADFVESDFAAAMICSDFDESYKVDIADLQVLVEYWLYSCTGTGWCGGADLDRSGNVNSIDFADFANVFTGN